MHSTSPITIPQSIRSSSLPTPATYYSPEQQLLHPAPIRGRALVINSSISLVQTFLFFYHREPAVLICWTLGQQAFNACMILILDAWETHNYHNEWLLNQAYAVFDQLERCGVHSLATMAARRISDGLTQLSIRKQEQEFSEMSRRPSSSQKANISVPMDLTIDTALMTDFSGDQVMGSTGMYLLEDSGLQSHQQTAFQPFIWSMTDSSLDSTSANPSNPSRPPSPPPQVPAVSVSNVPIAPFPVMAPPYMPSASTIPVTNSPFALGLQPRMPTYAHHVGRRIGHGTRLATQGGPRGHGDSGFKAINTHAMHDMDIAQMSEHRFVQRDFQSAVRRATGGSRIQQDGSRGVHRVDRAPRSQQRRSANRH